MTMIIIFTTTVMIVVTISNIATTTTTISVLHLHKIPEDEIESTVTERRLEIG